jgi:uncharacterized membrane protein YsdA (DUF1294 family)
MSADHLFRAGGIAKRHKTNKQSPRNAHISLIVCVFSNWRFSCTQTIANAILNSATKIVYFENKKNAVKKKSRFHAKIIFLQIFLNNLPTIH